LYAFPKRETSVVIGGEEIVCCRERGGSPVAITPNIAGRQINSTRAEAAFERVPAKGQFKDNLFAVWSL